MELPRVVRTIETMSEIVSMPGSDVDEFRDEIREARDTLSCLYDLWRETDTVLENCRNHRRPSMGMMQRIVDNLDELS